MKYFIGQARKHTHDEGGVSDYGFTELYKDPNGNGCVMLRGTFTVDELRSLINAIETKSTKDFRMIGEITLGN